MLWVSAWVLNYLQHITDIIIIFIILIIINVALLLQNDRLLLCTVPLPLHFLVSSGSAWASEPFLQALVVFRVSTQSTLTIFTVSICAHAWWAHGQRIATYIHTYIHTHIQTYISTGDFLVCMIYVGLKLIFSVSKINDSNADSNFVSEVNVNTRALLP